MILALSALSAKPATIRTVVLAETIRRVSKTGLSDRSVGVTPAEPRNHALLRTAVSDICQIPEYPARDESEKVEPNIGSYAIPSLRLVSTVIFAGVPPRKSYHAISQDELIRPNT